MPRDTIPIYEGDESYMQETAESSFYEFLHAFIGVTPGSVVISVVALLIIDSMGHGMV